LLGVTEAISSHLVLTYFTVNYFLYYGKYIHRNVGFNVLNAYVILYLRKTLSLFN
jgi:hypothetical protein